MAQSQFDAIFKEVEVTPDRPLFYQRICSLLSRHDISQLSPLDLSVDDFDELSHRLDKTVIQESCSVRNVMKARLLANYLIKDDGELASEHLLPLIEKMKKSLYSLSPQHEHDAVRDEHIVKVLEKLNQKEYARTVRNISRPFANKLAEDIIRDTLLIPQNVAITDVHVRRACLASWFTMLRQSLGSCFATAPSILIQEEQPMLFLRDLDEMMSTGRIKRTFGGVEYNVPMSSTWGNGDLKKPFVLYETLQEQDNKIWMSPGLIAALEEVSVLQKEASLKEKIHETELLLKAALPLLEKPGPLFLIDLEEVIRIILLHHHGIRKKDIHDYLNRPKNMLQSGLIMHVPAQAKGAKRKMDPCGDFLKDFELAKTAFKALGDNALLKAWEFTIASFSEIKLDFARYNLYASLGVNHDDPGGIGECIYKIVSLKIEHANAYLKEREEEYEQIVQQMRYLEARAKSASTEKEIEWMKVEYQSRQTELYHIEQQRNIAYEKAKKVGALYDFLITEYDKKFCDYFQEIYDADIHDIASGPFDDAPAGFRLIYKHGRSNPSQWTRIMSHTDFIDSLVAFFTITEQEFSTYPQVQGVESDFSIIITQLVSHVRSDYFLETSLYRMAKAHGSGLMAKPLEHLDQVEKKPWVYTSGGSMSTLVSAYFKRDEKPFEVSRWVESESELFAFFIDTLRQLPTKVSNAYLEEPNKSMLIHSPTHAFLLKPGFPVFREGWTGDMYSYSWIKHVIVEPQQAFLETLYVDEEIGQEIIQELIKKVPGDFKPRFKEVFARLPYRMQLRDFRDDVVNSIRADRGLRSYQGPVLPSDEIDSELYSLMPYISLDKVHNLLREILSAVFEGDEKLLPRVDVLLDRFWSPLRDKNFISSKQFQNLLKAFASLVLGATRSNKNLNQEIMKEIRKRNLAMPYPVIFADTNWVKDYFAFVVSPASYELEFWSVNILGSEGRPVSHWKQWLNGSQREPKWGIYSKPHEYVG